MQGGLTKPGAADDATGESHRARHKPEPETLNSTGLPSWESSFYTIPHEAQCQSRRTKWFTVLEMGRFDFIVQMY